MDRRSMLRLLGGTVAVPALAGFTPESLFAEGQRLNSRINEFPPSGHDTIGRLGPLGPFDAHQNKTVDVIAELIIPATDTPGARAARVNEFIALMVAKWYTEEQRQQFFKGLTSIDELSTAATGRKFVDGTFAQQGAILTTLDAESAVARKTPNAKPHFFQEMKWLTLYGYYTSDIGVNRELKRPVWPGRYDPCAATGIRAPGGH